MDYFFCLFFQMSVHIKLPNETFNFSDLSLGEPSSLSNGFYLSNIKHNGDLYIQTPIITTKGGFIKSSNKNYIDLVFTSENEVILEWFENLENRVKVLIYENRNDWFAEPNIEMSDIENIFISPIRTYKSGKQFVLRANVDSLKSSFVQVNGVKVYDRNQNEVSIDMVDNTSSFISLLHVSGVKFSSRTFQIYVEIKQIMIMDEKPDMFSKCLLGTSPTTAKCLEEPDVLKKNLDSDESVNIDKVVEETIENVIEGAEKSVISDSIPLLEPCNEGTDNTDNEYVSLKEDVEGDMNVNVNNDVIDTVTTADETGDEIIRVDTTVVENNELVQSLGCQQEVHQEAQEVHQSVDQEAHQEAHQEAEEELQQEAESNIQNEEIQQIQKDPEDISEVSFNVDTLET